jgi:hypothetical protein
MGNFIVSNNAYLVSFQATALKSVAGIISILNNNVGLAIFFAPLRTFEVICESGSGSLFADLLDCTGVSANRTITASSATTVTSSLLMFASGHLNITANAALSAIIFPSLSTVVGRYLGIYSNALLATVNLPSLSTVIGYLAIQFNPSLTFTHLPKLTHIGDRLFICQNSASFTIPSVPPNVPTGGLVVTGSNKSQPSCYYQQGSGLCVYINCP